MSEEKEKRTVEKITVIELVFDQDSQALTITYELVNDKGKTSELTVHGIKLDKISIERTIKTDDRKIVIHPLLKKKACFEFDSYEMRFS